MSFGGHVRKVCHEEFPVLARLLDDVWQEPTPGDDRGRQDLRVDFVGDLHLLVILDPRANYRLNETVITQALRELNRAVLAKLAEVRSRS